MLLEVLLICSLTQSAPFYDCSEQWEIRIYDSPPNIQCGNLSQKWTILACQNYEKRIIKKINFSPGENPYYHVNTIHIFPIADEKDECGNSILSHEILHAQGFSHIQMAKKFDCQNILEYDISKHQ